MPTVDEIMASWPEDKREKLTSLRNEILASLPEGYEEGVQYGCLAYYIPHSVYPKGYHCDPKQPVPGLCLAHNKSGFTIHAMIIYGDPSLYEWFIGEVAKTGKKLNMGKGCIRFKKPDDLPDGLIGKLIANLPVDKYLARYETMINSRKR